MLSLSTAISTSAAVFLFVYCWQGLIEWEYWGTIFNQTFIPVQVRKCNVDLSKLSSLQQQQQLTPTSVMCTGYFLEPNLKVVKST